MDLALRTERRIPLNEECDFPTWSPDEAQIAVECLDGNIHVIVIDATQELVVRCGERGLGTCGSPQWSPDGGYIAWNAGEPFGAPLTLRLTHTSCLPNVPTCADQEVVLGAISGPFVWAPDSQRIVGEYSGEDGNTTLGLVNIHDPPSLPPTPITVADPVSLAGSPDGRFLAFTEDGPFEPDPIRIVAIRGGDVTSVSVPEVGAQVQFWFQVPE